MRPIGVTGAHRVGQRGDGGVGGEAVDPSEHHDVVG